MVAGQPHEPFKQIWYTLDGLAIPIDSFSTGIHIESAATDFQFTAADPDLTASASRDPLGLEIIWTQFGQRVIPHFSTISTGATNFGVSLTLTWLVDTYLQGQGEFVFTDGERWRAARDGLLVAAETLHILSSVTVLDDYSRLLGNYKGKGRLSNDPDPMVGPFESDALLTRQLSLGVNGRYRQPLTSMGLLNERGWVDSPDEISSIVAECSQLEGLRDSVFSFFDAMREADDHRAALSEFGGVEQMAAVRGPQARKSFAPVLLDNAGISPESDELIAHVYRNLELPYRGAEHARDIFYGLAESDDLDEDQLRRVQDVCRVEEILLRFQALFDQLWTGGIDRLASRRVIEQLQERSGALQALMHRPGLSNIARQRLRGLIRVLEASSAEDVVRRLVRDYHRDTIADYRGNAEWVTFEGDRVVILNNGHSPPEDPLEHLDWSRTYYVPALATFKTEIQEVM